MDKFLTVSVVVCTYSHERYFDTIETIDSLIRQSYQNIEIILVIDQNLSLFNDFDKSNYLKSLNNFKLGISNLPGLSNARNKGVELSSGDIIAFIDDDAIADIYWIYNLVICYKNPEIFGVGGPVKPLWVSGEVTWIPEEFYWTMGCSYKSQKNTIHCVRSNFGSNMSFRSIIFEKIGYFDDKFGLVNNNMRTGEDTDLSIRVLNEFKNSKIIYNPKAIVNHKIYRFRKSFAFLMRRCYGYGVAIANIGSSKKLIDNQLESTETKFLNYIFKFSFPERFKNISHLTNIYTNTFHIIALVMFCIAVFTGFVSGKFIRLINNWIYFE
jgi:glycosyltransferase involved in cell wall biosynthesis